MFTLRRFIVLALVTLAIAVALASLAPIPAAPATPPSSAAADTAYAHQDWARAAQGYAALVQSTPASGRFWYRLGFARYSLSQFAPAAEAFRRADAIGAPPLIVRHDLACALARAGRRDSAFAALDRLLDAGYRQTQQLRDDEDLAGLRKDPRFAAVLERSQHNETPCSYRDESRQFDFWIGDWDVTSNLRDGAAAGRSHVELILGRCVIFENWTDRFGGSGKSFNAWNADLGCWQQNWMDDTGDVTNYSDGHVHDGTLTFVAEKKDGHGAWQKHRLSFTKLDADHVRQLGEHSADGGSSWQTDYDLLYSRRK